MQIEALFFLYEVEVSWRSQRMCLHLTFAKCCSHFGSGILGEAAVSCNVSDLLQCKAWYMVYPSPGGRKLYLENWCTMVCTSILGQKTEDNTAQDGITEAGKREQERNQGVQVQLQENFEARFFQKELMIILKMKFTFPGQWPWTLASNSSEENRHAEASQVVGMVSDRCEMYCHEEQCQNKVRSSPWSLCTRLDPHLRYNCRSTLWFWIQTLSPPSNFHLFQDLCEFGNPCLHWVKILAQLGEAEVQGLATQCPAE